MSALAQCDAFAFIYDQAGDPAPDVLVVLKRVLDANGNPILLGPKTTTTDSAGSFHFTLPEAATAFISARASALWNCPDGRAFTVPPGPSGELVPDFSLPASTLVEPPLVYVGDVLSIPKASASQDGYLSAADFVAFEAGAAMGVNEIDTGAGLTGGPITDIGTISLAPVSGVAGTWENPSSITVNAYGQIIAISGVADTTAPVISAISATAITSSGATILWTTDDLSDSQVEYGTTTSYGSTTTLDAALVTSHSVPITGTAASTLYHYRVKSRNTSGLLTTSGDNTFMTLAGPDTTAPVISAIAATSITDVGVTITWTTDEASDSQVDYGVTTSYGSSTTIDATMTTSHSVPITGLIASTPYHYRVKSRNAVSLLQTSGDNTFTTVAPLPPVNTLLTGLTSMWRMDETGLAVRVDSHGANNLTASGTVTAVAGVFGNAAHFAGGERLGASSSTSLQTGPVDYTIAMWVNLDTKSVPQCLMSKGDIAGANEEYSIKFYTNGTDTTNDKFFASVVTVGGTNTSVGADTFGMPAIGQWYLVVFWHDQTAGTMNIQINDGPVDSHTPVPPLFAGPGALSFGALDVNSQYLYGAIDEAAFWNGRILPPADRTALFNGGSGLPFSDWTT